MSRLSRIEEREKDLRFAVEADEREAMEIIHGADPESTSTDVPTESVERVGEDE